MRTRRLLALGVVVMMLTAGLAQAQVLEQVPADAMAVVKVKNLKATSDKLAKFATDLGLAQMVPQMADPLGFFEQELKISAGLDRNGEMAFVFLDPEKAGGDGEKAMIMLLPVTDYEAFLGNFGEVKKEGEVAEVKIGDNPLPGFMANWGKYAAVSPNRELVVAKPSATVKVTAAAAAEAASKDILVFANFPTIRARVIPKINESREEILKHVEEGLREKPETEKFASVARVTINQLLNMVEAFMRDTDAATFGFTFAPEGIAVSALADFQPESYLGKTAASLKNVDDLMLTGLPAGKYLMFGGGSNDPAVTGRLIDDFTQPIIDELNKIGGDEAAAIIKYVASVKKQVTASTGQTFGMVAPSGNLGQEPIFQFVSIMSGDVKTLRNCYVDMMKSQEEMMKAFGGPPDMVKTSYTPNAKTIDGVSFDLVQSQFNMQASGDPEAAKVQMMMNYMYGPNGVTVLVGDVNEKLIVGMGVSDEVISGTISAVKANSSPLADDAGVKSVVAQLPKSHTGIFFIPVDVTVSTGLLYAKQFGFPVPVQLPPDLPPVGVSIGTEGTAFRVDSFIPSSLVQSLVAAGMQAAIQMQGGGGPGKGGGL